MLALNGLYLAWAGWIDAPNPTPPVATDTAPDLPQLTLVTDQDTPDSPLARPVTVAATDEDLTNASSQSRCVSVGPFNELSQAARAAALLSDRGFKPRQRAERGDLWEGFWVYVGVKSAADETKLIKSLERSGISDAHTMPATAEGRRVSVGLFSDKDRAEKRAQAVKRLGFDAEIVERKQAASVYWVDMDLGANDHTVPTEGLISIGDEGARLEIRVCPSAEPTAPVKPTPLPRDARPAATTADAGAPQPG
jgi:hypothetical protein